MGVEQHVPGHASEQDPGQPGVTAAADHDESAAEAARRFDDLVRGMAAADRPARAVALVAQPLGGSGRDVLGVPAFVAPSFLEDVEPPVGEHAEGAGIAPVGAGADGQHLDRPIGEDAVGGEVGDCRVGRWRAVDGHQDALGSGCPYHQDGARRVIDDLCRDGAQQHRRERAATAAADHDQVGVELGRPLDDERCRPAVQDRSAAGSATATTWKVLPAGQVNDRTSWQAASDDDDPSRASRIRMTSPSMGRRRGGVELSGRSPRSPGRASRRARRRFPGGHGTPRRGGASRRRPCRSRRPGRSARSSGPDPRPAR